MKQTISKNLTSGIGLVTYSFVKNNKEDSNSIKKKQRNVFIWQKNIWYFPDLLLNSKLLVVTDEPKVKSFMALFVCESWLEEKMMTKLTISSYSELQERFVWWFGKYT